MKLRKRKGQSKTRSPRMSEAPHRVCGTHQLWMGATTPELKTLLTLPMPEHDWSATGRINRRKARKTPHLTLVR